MTNLIRRGLPCIALLGASAGLLTGCVGTTGSAQAAPPAPTTTVTSQAGSAASARPASTVTSSAATPTGCERTEAGIPAGAKTKTTIDVDGDGKPDTEWFTASTFGITTSSGATSTVKPSISGAADPMALTGKLKGTDTVIVLIAGSRDVQTFRWLDCKIQPVVDEHDVQWRFDLTGQHGDGVGTEDSNGDGEDTLVGYELSPQGDTEPGQTVKITTTTININGLTASAGGSGTSTTSLPGGEQTLDHVRTVSIGSLNITHDGLTAPD